MPSPSSITRRSSRAQRSVTESGLPGHAAPKSAGLYQTALVQDRIRQWQANGAASAPAPDTVSVVSVPFSAISATPDSIETSARQEEDKQQLPQASQKQRKTGTKSHQRETVSHSRSSSTPRKRVVSDEHWKANRSLRRDDSVGTTETPELGDEMQESGPSNAQLTKSNEQARAEREERRRKRVEARLCRVHSSQEVAGKNNTREDNQDERTLESDVVHPPSGGGSQNQLANGRGEKYVSAVAEHLLLNYDPRKSTGQCDDRPVKRSRYVQTLGTSPPLYQDAHLRSKKGSFMNKTKEVFGIVDSIPVYSNRLPTIEAWLDDQVDPFNEEAALKVRFEDEEADSLKPSSIRRTISIANSPEETARSKSVFIPPSNGDKPDVELEIQDEYHGPSMMLEPELSSPVSLKRRGAKASRSKKHTSQHIPESSEKSEPRRESSSKDAQIDQKARDWSHFEPTRLSTIASVATLSDQTQPHDESLHSNQIDLSGKITTHDEMMSVLSRTSLRKSTRRKHSTKAKKSQQHLESINSILASLTEDEAKYSRELATLVDGVIPVLLQCVLSKSDAVAAAEFFTCSANLNNDASFSRPIINMGIALERLKTLHKRIPLHSVDSLISWCQAAHKAYSEYLSAWRLTLQDVVVNLAPLEGSEGETNEVMARNGNGDLVNSEGETVDIAYLMKRPLVNIRRLGRALSEMEEKLPEHPIVGKVAADYRELTAAAKTKHQQEKGRLEDEAAAAIDASKCRDIRSMAPLPGIKIEQNKRVRARDCFDLTLFHSSGQRMDCKIELILRDNQASANEGGDLLVCQIEEGGKWLLFAPINLCFVSARKDGSLCNLVLMMRGRAGLGQEWHEMLALKTEDTQAASEWMIMLGSNPLPPSLHQTPSFINTAVETSVKKEPICIGLTESVLKRVPSVEAIEVPIGEPSVLGVTISSTVDAEPHVDNAVVLEKPASQLNLGGGLQKKDVPQHWPTQRLSVAPKPVVQPGYPPEKSSASSPPVGSVPTYVSSSLAYNHHAVTKLKHIAINQPKPKPPESGTQTTTLPSICADNENSAPAMNGSSRKATNSEKSCEGAIAQGVKHSEQRAVSLKIQETHQQRNTTVVAPTGAEMESLPKVAKTRGNSSSNTPLTDSIRETWLTMSGLGRKTVSQPNLPAKKEKNEVRPVSQGASPDQSRSHSQFKIVPETEEANNDPPPSPPKHKEIPILGPRPRNIPTLGPSEAQIRMEKQKARVSYSPLRKEYRPSSASNSDDSDSESLYSSGDDSQTSEEADEVYHDELMARKLTAPINVRPLPGGLPQSPPTAGTQTLAPSDSASQAPYRRVPSSTDCPGGPQKRAVAIICSWNDRGTWDPLLDEYCSVVISPGLMEAFVMDSSHSSFRGDTQRPLAAFELTPMVPLRKSTGLDINIRSPPTPDSQIRTSNNIMFRSRSAAECETFYHMINWARFNNPTYIKLARDRPQPQPVVSFSNQQAPRPRSWFSFSGGLKRHNSYRVGNIPPSSMGESQATVNTVSSAMSALKRLTKSSSFNVNRSSLVHRPGLTTNVSLYSSSDGTGINSLKNSPPPSQVGFMPGKDGPNVPPTSEAALKGGGMVHNMRIRLQIRQAQGWVTLGYSRLTILPGVKPSSDLPEISRPGSSDSSAKGNEEHSRRPLTTTGAGDPPQRQFRLSSSGYTPHRLHGGGREKRVVVTSEKDPSRVLLDATLGESCFEKISQLGIAVQVWKEEDEVRSRGGVVLGQNTKYLFQFFHAKECAWVFDLVGKYRYNIAMTK